MADRQIQVHMLDVDDGSPVELVLGNPVSRVYSEAAASNEVTFTIPDTILKLSLGEVQISITVTSGGYTATKEYIIHPIEGKDVIDVDASYDSLVVLKGGDIVETIQAGSDHTIRIDWVDGDNHYVGQRDTRYIAPTVSTGSIEFLSNSGVTNIYSYTPPPNTNTHDNVTIEWGRHDDYDLVDSTSISKTIPLADAPFVGPMILNEGRTFAGASDTIIWSDDSGIPGRRYDLYINGVDQGPSVVYPATSWTVSNLPTDGSAVSVRIYWWDNDDLTDQHTVDATMIAYSAPVGTGSQFIIPETNIPEGQYNAIDWASGINGLSSIFWESGGDSITTVSEVDGRRAMTVRLDNSRTPSTRVGAGANLTTSDTATIEQWVYFDPLFDWGGSNEGGKLGFGLGGGSRPAGGLTKQDGFTARFMWRTNGQIYAYIYDASTSGYGDDYSTGFTATKGQWFHLKMEVGMNSSGGVADGTLKVWVNESLTINRSNMEWFGTGTPRVDSLLHFTFHGGNDSTWSPSVASYVSFSGIYWDTSSVPSSLTLIAPPENYVAESPDVYFAWDDPSNSNAVYDLHVYSDAARTQKVYGTNGVIFDTDSKGTGKSHTFTHDPSNGLPRYGLLWQWPDSTYNPAQRTELLFEYTAYTSTNPPPTGDFASLDALVPSWISAVNSKFDTQEMQTSTGGYHAFEALMGLKMLQDSGSAHSSSALQTAVRIAVDFANAGADLSGQAQHTGSSYSTNGYPDWRYGQGSTPNRINHYHYEWRSAAMMATAVHMINTAGGTGFTPSNAKSILMSSISAIWDKYDRNVNAPGTPPVVDNRTLNYAIGSDEVGRVCNMAMILDKEHSTPGSNKYYSHLNNKIPNFMSEYVSTGGYGMPRTDPAEASGVTPAWDISHQNDEVFAMAQSEWLGYGYMTTAFLNSIRSHNSNTMYPASRNDAWWPVASHGGANNTGLNSVFGASWGPNALFMTDAARDRLVTDYLANEPIRASHPETELKNIGALCAAIKKPYF